MRERIFTIIDKTNPNDRLSKVYNLFIMVIALVSLVPMMFKTSNEFLETLDTITVYILFLDYVLHFITYDFKCKYKDFSAFFLYPIKPSAIVDFLALLPTLGLVGHGFRMLRLLRIFKISHYSKSVTHIARAFSKEKDTLTSVLVIALGYIFVSALIMFSCEPDTFNTFFQALYWATTALTTVGYGDLYPITPTGQLISMVSSLFGIAIIALPAGIITASFVDEINLERKEMEKLEKLLEEEIAEHEK